MTIFIVLFVAVVILFAFSCCRVAGECTRQEELQQLQQEVQQESHCESCLRWSECNGVDEQCPHRKKETT